MAFQDSQGELTGLALELVSPISPDNAVGEDPKYSMEFEAIKAEVIKTSERDWEMVAQNAQKMLTTQAKDITALGYYMLATAIARGWASAADVARAYTWLLTQHWETIHPQRDRARLNTLKWLSEERTVLSFGQIQFNSADFPALESMAKALGELRNLANEKWPDAPPSIKPLVQAIEDMAKSVKPAAEAKPAPPPPPSSAPVSGSAPAPAATVEFGEGATKSDLQKVLQKIALQILSQEPDSPLGYKLLRVNRWQEITVTPKNEAGVTLLPSPNKQRMAFLEGQHAQQAWAGILEKSETAFTEPGIHFWLDLQFYVVSAMDGKGLGGCAEVVRQELKALLKRVPALVDLKYNDGTPFASPATRGWLDTLATEGSGPAARSAAVREETLADDLNQAQDMAFRGFLSEALELLQSGLLYGDNRGRTERRLAIARLALQYGKFKPALAVAAELSELSAHMGLAQWEPALSSAIFEVHYKSLKAAIDSGTGDFVELTRRREELISRHGRDNPSLVARLDY